MKMHLIFLVSVSVVLFSGKVIAQETNPSRCRVTVWRNGEIPSEAPRPMSDVSTSHPDFYQTLTVDGMSFQVSTNVQARFRVINIIDGNTARSQTTASTSLAGPGALTTQKNGHTYQVNCD